MSNTIKIYGASDDLIEVEDKASGNDEYGAYGGPRYVRFNDGTILKAEYAPDGYGANWKVERVADGTAAYRRDPVDLSAEDPEPNSDVVCLTGPGLKVTGCGKAMGQTKEELVELMEDFRPQYYTADQLARIYAIRRESKGATTVMKYEENDLTEDERLAADRLDAMLRTHGYDFIFGVTRRIVRDQMVRDGGCDPDVAEAFAKGIN